MKKFRLLAAMVITVVMLFTVALAAEVSYDAIKYNGTDDTVTFVVKANNDLAIDAYSTLAIDYDSAVYTVASKTSSFAAAEITDYIGRIEWCNPSGDAAIAKGDALLTVVFNVTDKAAAVGSTFATNVDMTFVSAFNAGGDILDMVTSVTVEAAAPAVTFGEKETKTAIVPEKTVTLDGVEYTNVALFAGSLNLGEIKAALVGGEDAELRAAGIKLGDDVKHSFDIAGNGAVEYKVLFYNITSAQADALNISTYYTVYDIVD